MDDISTDAEYVPPRSLEITNEQQSEPNETGAWNDRPQRAQIEFSRDSRDECTDTEGVPPRSLEITLQQQSEPNETGARNDRPQRAQIEISKDPPDEYTDIEGVPPRSLEITHQQQSEPNETGARNDRQQRAQIEISKDPPDECTDIEGVPPRSLEITHQQQSEPTETGARNDRPQRAQIEFPRYPHDECTDTEGVPPRALETTHEQQTKPNIAVALNSRLQRQIEIPRDPHDEWELNSLLEKIASSVTDVELAKIKLLFRGHNGLRKRILERCNTCAKLFGVLREEQYILRGNIVYLNRILYVLDKPELIEEAAKYCRKEGNAVYYYSTEVEAEDGSSIVMFHIVTETNGINQETIDRLRNNVAKIVCAPLEVVRIVAVEPSSSLLVSIIMPDVYVRVLEKLLQQKADMWELKGLEVDFIEIHDKHYSVTDVQEIVMTETEQQRKFMNVYQQLEQKRKEFEDIQLQVVEYQESIKELKVTCETLQKLHMPTPDGEAALSDLRLYLHQASTKGQDMDLTQKLLETNTLLVSAYTRNFNEAQRKKNKAIWEEKASLELKLWQLLISKSKPAEDVLMLKYRHCTFLEDCPIRQEVTSISFDICKLLTKEERYKLMQLQEWGERDIVKACIDTDEKLLLLGLECKEAARIQSQVNTLDFMSILMKKIQREDLIEIYRQKVKEGQLSRAVPEEHLKYAADLASRYFTEEHAEHALNMAAGTILKLVKPTMYEELSQKVKK